MGAKSSEYDSRVKKPWRADERPMAAAPALSVQDVSTTMFPYGGRRRTTRMMKEIR